MNKKCYIIGAGDNFGTKFYKKENEYVIAADGGLEILETLGVEPDLIMGDFDSLGFVPKGENVICYPVEKDDTDMMLAVKRAVEMGYNEIELYGATGGRTDHTIANLQTMLWASKNNCKIKMIDEKNTYYMITNDSVYLPAKRSGGFSVFAFGKNAKGVTIKGGKYEALNVELSPDNPTAVSNSFIGKEVEISVREGSLLIITE